jgi:hypothetical protein
MILATIIWIFCVFFSMWVKHYNDTRIVVGDLILALIFGPIYLIIQCSSLDTILWEKKP